MPDQKGKLFLLPNTLGGSADFTVPPAASAIVKNIDHFIVEELRSARRLLRAIEYKKNFEEVEFFLLNEHSNEDSIDLLLHPALKGNDIALLSEAGSPCIADPGSAVVREAHKNNIKVVPLCGASSILLALISSGLNGQNFAFTGYLPKDKAERVKRVKQLEQSALTHHQTQVFMDAPYRNDQVLGDMLSVLRPDTLLCIAADITCENEYIRMMSIREWKENIPQLHKRPVMFVLGK